MRYMILVKASKLSEGGGTPPESMMVEMADYHEALAKAGMLVDASGLHPSSEGWRIRYEGNKRTVVDGPFAESKELIAGFTTIEVTSREEAVEWSKRFPNPAGEDCEIEVRQIIMLDEFEDSETIDRFRALEAGKVKP